MGAIILFALVFQRAPVKALSTTPVTLTAGPSRINLNVPAAIQTVDDFLETYDIETHNAIIVPPKDTLLIPNMTITIIPTRSFALHDGAEAPRTITTTSTTIGDALVGVELTPLDYVSPSLATALYEGMVVHITRVVDIERKETVTVPFDTITVDDVDRLWGSEDVRIPGQEGSAEEEVRLRFINGELLSRTVLSYRLINEPSPRHVRRGVKIVVDRIQEGGASWYRYKNCDCAAHSEYPRGTWLRVTNLLDGAQQIVRTNDWGPDPAVHPDRVIDLDATVFERFAPLWKGLIPVRVEHLVTQ